jgi:hypothetical protein
MIYDLLTIESSPLDVRDLVIESIHPEVEYPRVLDMRGDLPQVWDQGVDGPCSAFAAAAIKMWQEKKDYGLKEELSKYFIYNIRSNRPQPGMNPRDTMKILQKYGVPTAKSYNLRKMGIPERIPQWVWQEAENHRIIGYARIMTIEGLKKSLSKNGPAYAAMPVFNDSDSFWKPGFGDKLLGGHAVVIAGYNDQGFIIRNSWGRNWSNAGHTIYPYSDFGAHYEIWTMVDDPNSQPLTQAAHPRPVEEVKEVKSRKTILDIFKSIFKKK